MGIAQRKTGAIVLEPVCGGLPVLCVVAIATGFPQIQLVLVLCRVAAVAVLGRILVLLRLMAILAFGLGMFTHQREVALVMVELGNVFPVLLGVATCAILA